MWNHTPTDGKTRRPATALFLLTLCIAVVIGVRLLFPNSALRYYYLVFIPAHGPTKAPMLLAFTAVAALVQWLLLRNELLDIAVWLPTVLSALGMLAGEAAHAFSGGFDALWLISLGAPVNTGSALVILLAWLLPFRRE